MAFEYATIEEIMSTPGLRLVLSRGVPGPWGEAIKSVLAHKQLDYVAAAQKVGAENPELMAWTGQASAPVLVWNEERPCVSWLEKLHLVERLAPQRPLLGSSPEARAAIIGICHEIAGEGGLGWNRRTQLTGWVMETGAAPPFMSTMAARYGYSEATYASCGDQLARQLEWLASLLAAQSARGSRYLVGDEVSAADFYLANFVGMLDPLPHAMNPMPDGMRASYSYRPDALAAALSPSLLEYRDQIYAHHIQTPLEF